MSNLYQLQAKIHKLLHKINKQYGLEIEIESDYTWHEYSGYVDSKSLTEYKKYNKKEYYHNINSDPLNCDLIADRSVIISPPLFLDISKTQIRQILIGLKDVLGENPEIEKNKILLDKLEEEEKVVSVLGNEFDNYVAKENLNAHKVKIHKTVESQAEALCQRWLDGLEPLFDREPEKVLQELIEILENLLK